MDAGQEHLRTTRLKPGGTARVNCGQCLQPLFNDISLIHVVSVFPSLFADFQLRPQYHLFAEEVMAMRLVTLECVSMLLA